LEGEPGPARDVVCLNAAAGILAGNAASDWRTAVDAAWASIDSGRAKEKLEALAAFTQEGLEPARA
jgi:anthranilate phosphoribosyltransferase